MDVVDKHAGLGLRLGDELPISEKCLGELRKIKKELSKIHERRFEIFDFGLDNGLASEKTIEKSLERLMRACIWHAIALKTEFKLKLLYSIDGYLSAVDAKNPVSTFLLARYLLELVATISAIDFKLEECIDMNLHDWKGRATMFFAMLYRARHSTSDEKFKAAFAKHGIPEKLIKPIHILPAINGLASRPGFKSAVSMYHRLSNICHHNGSGHKMFVESARETNATLTPGGKAIFLDEKVAVMTMGYPALDFEANSLGLTARVAWWSAHCANKIISELRETPFTDKELSALTDGRLSSAEQCFAPRQFQMDKYGRAKAAKVGRNDLCPCGSGKKYKLCCWRKLS